MTGRDRLMLIGIVTIAILGATWMMVVSPERKKAKTAAGEVAAAQSKLDGAKSALKTAQGSQEKYAASYATIVSLGKAVPTSQEVPSLIYELAQSSKQKNVEFTSIASTATKAAASSSSSSSSGKSSSGSGGSSSGSSSSSSSGSSSSSPAAAAAGFQQVPFTFVFNGSYFGLEHMLHQLTDLASRRSSGALKINGRLFTIQSVAFAPVTLQGHSHQLSATVTATAYALPAEAAAATGSGSAASAGSGSSSSSSSPTAPAVVGAK